MEGHKSRLEASWLEYEIIHLNNDKIEVTNLVENHKEFIKNYKIMLKLQQEFKI